MTTPRTTADAAMGLVRGVACAVVAAVFTCAIPGVAAAEVSSIDAVMALVDGGSLATDPGRSQSPLPTDVLIVALARRA